MIIIALCVHLGIWFVAALASSITAVNVILQSLDEELESQVQYMEFSSRLFIAFIGSLEIPADENIGMRGITLSEKIGWEGNPMLFWDMNGKMIYRTANAPLFDAPSSPGFFEDTVARNGEKSRWRVLYKPVADTFWVAVAVDTRESRQAIVRVAIEALYPMVLIIPFTIIGIYLGTARGLRPIAKVAEAVGSRSPMSLEPVDTDGIHQELRPMLDALNGLLGRLSLALENEHRFTANAAHELKTPLTAIKAELQMHQRSARDPATAAILGSIASRVDRAVYTVRQLLVLAQIESRGASLEKSRVDLHQLAEQSLADHGHLIVERKLQLEFPEGEQWFVQGQPESLGIMLGNLLANAFHYTPVGGRIQVRAQLVTGTTVFSVANDYAPMTDKERKLLADRFYRRPGTDQPGAGVGLSIVHRVAEVHQAPLEISGWHGDEGLLISICFPA